MSIHTRSHGQSHVRAEARSNGLAVGPSSEEANLAALDQLHVTTSEFLFLLIAKRNIDQHEARAVVAMVTLADFRRSGYHDTTATVEDLSDIVCAAPWPTKCILASVGWWRPQT